MSRQESSAPGVTPGDEPGNWALVRRMLALSWRYRWGCLQVLALQTGMLVMLMGGLALFGLGVDYLEFRFGNGKPPRWPWGLNPPAEWNLYVVLGVIAAGVLIFAAVRGVLFFTETVARSRLVNQQIVVDLRQEIYAKLQRLSFRFFDDNASGSIINRVTGDVQAIRMFVEQVVVQTIALLLTVALYVGYMANIHVWLTLACLATTPLLWFISGYFGKLVRPAYRRNRELMDKMILRVSESLQGVHVVKGFAREDDEIARFKAANDEVADQQQWIFWRVAIFQPVVGMLTHVNLIVLLAYGGYLVIRRHGAPAGGADVGITLGNLLVFSALLQQFATQVGNISVITNSAQQAMTGARRVFEVLDAPVTIQSPPRPVHLDRARGKVEFDHVNFSYKPDEPVLNDVSFTVQPGQCVAIVGPTGCGKSTLLSLIPRFYDPTAGCVKIDDVDIRDYDVDSLRRNIGLVFQESFLFSNTVAANIAFGHPQATQEQIEKAAKIACAHEFIVNELPKGYDTILGEYGADLSGGQRQRLAIARAILLEPAILLLDDPTAAIDPRTEGEILEAMDNAMTGRTTFVVAHRLSTLRRADLVIVLEGGRIAQTGTHAELMNLQGHYRYAAQLQSADTESRRILGFTEPVYGEDGGGM